MPLLAAMAGRWRVRVAIVGGPAMLNMDDAEQTAVSVNENKKQEQSELEPLPWEVGKGFLWGLPATVIFIIFHPVRFFQIKPCSAWHKALLFALVLWYVYFIATVVYEYVSFSIKTDIPITNLMQRYYPLALLALIKLPLLFLVKALAGAVSCWASLVILGIKGVGFVSILRWVLYLDGVHSILRPLPIFFPYFWLFTMAMFMFIEAYKLNEYKALAATGISTVLFFAFSVVFFYTVGGTDGVRSFFLMFGIVTS